MTIANWHDKGLAYWRRSPETTCIASIRACYQTKKKKVKWSCYRSGVAQRVGRGIALLFHDRGTRSGWVVSSRLRPHFTPGKDPIPILQEAGWPPGPVWTGGKSRPHRDSIPDRPARSHSLYSAQVFLSTQVFLGFPVPKSKCWDGTQNSKLPLHASHVAHPT